MSFPLLILFAGVFMAWSVLRLMGGERQRLVNELEAERLAEAEAAAEAEAHAAAVAATADAAAKRAATIPSLKRLSAPAAPQTTR